MAKYVYGKTLIPFEVAKSGDVATELIALETVSAAEEIRTDESIKMPAGEGKDVRIVSTPAQRANKVLVFDSAGQLIVLSAGDASIITTAADLNVVDADSNFVSDNVEEILAEIASSLGGLNTKVIDIGDWDMTAANSVNVIHGLTVSKIRSVLITIRDDDGVLYSFDNAEASLSINVSWIINPVLSWVALSFDSGGIFNSAAFNSTSYNRGWVTINYV